jgi:hypothetical protein
VVRFRSQAEAVTLGIVRFFLHILFLGTFMYVVCVKIQFKVCPKGWFLSSPKNTFNYCKKTNFFFWSFTKHQCFAMAMPIFKSDRLQLEVHDITLDTLNMWLQFSSGYCLFRYLRNQTVMHNWVEVIWGAIALNWSWIHAFWEVGWLSQTSIRTSE